MSDFKSQPAVQGLVAQYMEGGSSRRQFVKGALALGLGMTTIGRNILCAFGLHRWEVRAQSIAVLMVQCRRCGVVWYCSHDGATWWREAER